MWGRAKPAGLRQEQLWEAVAIELEVALGAALEVEVEVALAVVVAVVAAPPDCSRLPQHLRHHPVVGFLQHQLWLFATAAVAMVRAGPAGLH